jgi:methylamine--corrinoid protein Co-methyltransferase
MLDKLVALYEKDFKTAPKGKTFQETYDVFTLSPSKEYVEVFDKAIKRMEGLGFEFKI